MTDKRPAQLEARLLYLYGLYERLKKVCDV